MALRFNINKKPAKPFGLAGFLLMSRVSIKTG
ncbi:hypothetical protein MED193_05479 [Roseobacter sp. MED193]|nr:hypothetical protein MED193_05479 [Roseobacter sp. MED193]